LKISLKEFEMRLFTWSATRMSPRTPDRWMPSCAFSMQPASVSASFKQGITIVSPIASVTPKI